MSKNKDFGLIFWVHIFVICLMYSSPFLFSWKIIFAGILVYYLQLLIFGGCVLTIKELGAERKEGFNAYYLRRLGFRVNERKLSFVLDYIVPWAILAFALVWQLFLKHSPLF
ncbi:MAG: hypothetical protein HYX21_01050 [Candidatus Yanofskybacteria bacterium]|nr:hypothetical protein [Candidatus Yanofskybacteria bacterium]